MDDSEPPAGKLQIEPQDGRHPGGGVESVGSRLPSASDENENRLDGCGHDRLTSSDSAMGNPAVSEQDSLNNNAGCTPSCEAATSETPENTACEGPKDGQDFSGKDENIPAKRSPRTKTGTARKIPPGIVFNYCMCHSLKTHFLPHPHCIGPASLLSSLSIVPS